MPPRAAPAYWPPGSQEFYDRGYQDQRRGLSLGAVVVAPERLQVYQLGYNDAAAGRERQVLQTTDADLPVAQRDNPVPGAPPVPPGQLTPAAGEALYQQGYQNGYDGAPPRGDVARGGAPGTASDFYFRGYDDGARARQSGAPPTPASWRGLPRLDPNVGYELLGSVPLFGAEPLNVVELAERIGLPVRYQLLGFRPSDARQGFKLSGPNGRAIQLAREVYGNRTPAEVGLPGFVAAVDWRPGEGFSVRLLEAEELEAFAEVLQPTRARY